MASLSESRQNLLEAAKTAALEAETLFNESMEIREEINNLIGEYAEKFQAKFIAFQFKKKEYSRLRAQFDCKTLGISDELMNLLERNYENFPAIRFSTSFHNALEILIRENYKQERAQMRAA
jgi:hypothetical protein